MPGPAVHFRWRHALLATALLAAAGRGVGVDVQLSPAEIQQAVRAGTAMVSPRNGYIARPYVLHEYNTGIRIKPNSPLIDALTVATPYERVRYYSYLEAYQGNKVSLSGARKVAQQNANHLTVLAFAHSPVSVQAELEAWQQVYVKHEGQQPVQRTFLDDFKPATLSLGGRTLTSRIVIEGPYQDAFSTEGNPEFRYLGVVHFEFDLSPLAHGGQVEGVGVLRFKDPKGRAYVERINLAQYR